jgi:hypothetical protein
MFRFLRWSRNDSRARRKVRFPLFLELLETRTVPTVLWSSAGSLSVVDQGGPVIAHVDVGLVFWGAAWSRSQALMDNLTNSVREIMRSPYLSGLSQYRGVGNGQLLRTDLITSTSPAAHTTLSQFATLVKTNLDHGTLPVTPDMDSQILYVVIPQPGTTDPAENLLGAHATDVSSFGRFHFECTFNNSNLDNLTFAFSHELTESVTDPEVNFRNAFIVNNFSEICDGEAPNYSYRLNGVLVQSSLSEKDLAYAIYDGNTQNLALTRSQALTVNDDQLANVDDTITVDSYKATLNGTAFESESVTLNGETFAFDSGTVSSITVTTGSGDDTVNIEASGAGVPVTVNLGSGRDTVNLTPTDRNLFDLWSKVTINGSAGADSTLNIFDQLGVNRLFDVHPNDINYTLTSTTLARQVDGTGMITVAYRNLANLAINTSNGTDRITVQSTPTGTAVAINGGSSTNTLVGSTVTNSWRIRGSNSGTLSSASIAGLVTFTSMQNLSGGTATDAFIFSDGAGMSGNIRVGASFDYSAYTTDVSVNLQRATATGVGGTFSGIQTFTGGSGNNALVGAKGTNVWTIGRGDTGTVTVNGTTTEAFTRFQNLTGGSTTNRFVFSDGAGISGNLNGGGGALLDYSAYSTTVIVNLQNRTATGVGGSITNIQNVTGGNGGGAGVYNILVGNGGNTLTGGNGRRNLLIAGSSASMLLSGDGEDILIGGTTAYDMDPVSLMAIMDYWAGTSDDYATRVGTLLAGNSVPLLDATTVTGNGGNNKLNSNGGLALLYTDGHDTITGFNLISQQIMISP